jgi:hypothetical protein
LTIPKVRPLTQIAWFARLWKPEDTQ